MAIARALLIVGAVGGLTAWLIAHGTTVPAAPRASEAPVVTLPGREAAGGRSSPSRRDHDLDVQVGRLRAGLGAMPEASLSGRNPFRFGALPSPRAALTRAHAAAVAADAPSEPNADRPPMQLLGVATDASASVPVRTAVIATPRQLYLVREGEQIALRFLVLRITGEAVELRDLVSDEAFSLALR